MVNATKMFHGTSVRLSNKLYLVFLGYYLEISDDITRTLCPSPFNYQWFCFTGCMW